VIRPRLLKYFIAFCMLNYAGAATLPSASAPIEADKTTVARRDAQSPIGTELGFDDSFDDSFDGSFDDSFGGSVAEPQILGTSGWIKVDWVKAAGGKKKKKPGYVASRKGAELRIDTRQAGLQHVSIGYLQTYSSSAMVQVECEAPCSCTAEELRAHTSSRTSTTAMSPKLRAVAPAGATCTLRLRMLTDQQPFKLIAIHVEDPTGAAEDV